MIFVLIYIVGFILTLTFLKLYGKKIGFDYDPPHEGDYDDWEDNAQAYAFFSFFWIAFVPMASIVGLIRGLYKFTQWFLKYPNV
jgi:hypothetical protein